MDIEKLHIAIMSENWGNKFCQNDSFYRLLFKFEKAGKMNDEDVRWLFASYKRWFKRCEELLAKCDTESTGDREAREAGIKLKKDIITHVLQLINECENDETQDWNTKLVVMADMKIRELERKKAEDNRME